MIQQGNDFGFAKLSLLQLICQRADRVAGRAVKVGFGEVVLMKAAAAQIRSRKIRSHQAGVGETGIADGAVAKEGALQIEVCEVAGLDETVLKSNGKKHPFAFSKVHSHEFAIFKRDLLNAARIEFDETEITSKKLA